MSKQRSRVRIVDVSILAAILYMAVALLTLQIRHPWMTEAELLVNIGSALTFQSVYYDEARPRRDAPR